MLKILLIASVSMWAIAFIAPTIIKAFRTHKKKGDSDDV